MLLEDEFCEELANALHVEKLDNIYLVSKFLRSLLMPLKTLHSSLVPLVSLTGAATAEYLQDPDTPIL